MIGALSIVALPNQKNYYGKSRLVIEIVVNFSKYRFVIIEIIYLGFITQQYNGTSSSFYLIIIELF